LRGAWRGASSPRGCEDPPRLHRTPVLAGRQIDLVHGRRTVGAPDIEGPGLRPHLEGSHPDPPRANGVRASRPSSDFDAAGIHLGTPGERATLDMSATRPVQSRLPIGAVGRHRVQTVSEPLGGDYHGAARVASVSRRIRACIRTVSSQVGSGGRRVEVRTRMRSRLRSDSRSCLTARGSSWWSW